MEQFLEPNPKLSSDNFYPQEFKKKYLFLHHTCGGTASGAVSWWNQDNVHVGAPFIIEHDGTVIRTFPEKFWIYALGIKGGTYIERASVHIEIVNYGKLNKVGEKFYFMATSSKGVEVPSEEVITYKDTFRNAQYYHRYTEDQIATLGRLLKYLNQEFNLGIKGVEPNFWQYNSKFLNTPKPGIWSHTTVRLDKSDIHPQKELIEALYALDFGTI